jgi:hypothetical protein
LFIKLLAMNDWSTATVPKTPPTRRGPEFGREVAPVVAPNFGQEWRLRQKGIGSAPARDRGFSGRISPTAEQFLTPSTGIAERQATRVLAHPHGPPPRASPPVEHGQVSPDIDTEKPSPLPCRGTPLQRGPRGCMDGTIRPGHRRANSTALDSLKPPWSPCYRHGRDGIGGGLSSVSAKFCPRSSPLTVQFGTAYPPAPSGRREAGIVHRE